MECLFHSIAYSLYKSIDNEQTSRIRAHIVDHVFKHWNELQAWTVNRHGEPYQNKNIYREEMLQSRTYGSVCELIAAGRLYPLRIEVYRNGKLAAVFGEGPVCRFLFSGLHNSGHYDVIIEAEKQFIGTESFNNIEENGKMKKSQKVNDIKFYTKNCRGKQRRQKWKKISHVNLPLTFNYL